MVSYPKSPRGTDINLRYRFLDFPRGKTVPIPLTIPGVQLVGFQHWRGDVQPLPPHVMHTKVDPPEGTFTSISNRCSSLTTPISIYWVTVILRHNFLRKWPTILEPGKAEAPLQTQCIALCGLTKSPTITQKELFLSSRLLR